MSQQQYLRVVVNFPGGSESETRLAPLGAWPSFVAFKQWLEVSDYARILASHTYTLTYEDAEQDAVTLGHNSDELQLMYKHIKPDRLQLHVHFVHRITSLEVFPPEQPREQTAAERQAAILSKS